MTPRPHGSEEGDIFDARAEHMDEVVRAMMNRMGSTLPRSFLDGHYMMNELLLLVLDHPKTRLMVEAPVSPPPDAATVISADDSPLDLVRDRVSALNARVAVLEAEMRNIIKYGHQDAADIARRALRGSVPAGEDDDG